MRVFTEKLTSMLGNLFFREMADFRLEQRKCKMSLEYLDVIEGKKVLCESGGNITTGNKVL